MAPKIFLTGVTGYIAGDALHVLYKTHPEYEYAALVRTREKAEAVQKAYPSIRVVLGDLEDYEILREESAKADIVLHAADSSDHENSAKSITAGLLQGHSKESPGYWIHTGGTGILTYTDAERGCLGQSSEKQYNDWKGVGELISLPDQAFHRNVDKLVLEAGTKHSGVIKTALVCPPTIYGKGRGPVSGRGRQVYEMAKLILSASYVPIVGEGKAMWNNVHIADLSDVYLLLVEAAVTQKAGTELWGARAYYLTENGEHTWGELAEFMGKRAQALGFVRNLEKQTLSREQALEQAGFEAESWGLNSRARAERAKRLLGWQPHQCSLEEEVDKILKSEKAALDGQQ